MGGSEIWGPSDSVLWTPRSGFDIYLAHEKRPCPRPRPRQRFRIRIRFHFRFPGSPDPIFTALRRGDSFIFARDSVGPGSLETFRGTASGIGATVGNSISPNSFPGRVGRQEKPWVPAPFCKGHRGIVSFSGKIFNTIEKVTPHFAKVTCFLGPFATRVGPGRHRTDKTRHFRHMRPHFPDSVGTSGETFPTLPRK